MTETDNTVSSLSLNRPLCLLFHTFNKRWCFHGFRVSSTSSKYTKAMQAFCLNPKPQEFRSENLTRRDWGRDAINCSQENKTKPIPVERAGQEKRAYSPSKCLSNKSMWNTKLSSMKTQCRRAQKPHWKHPFLIQS